MTNITDDMRNTDGRGGRTDDIHSGGHGLPPMGPDGRKPRKPDVGMRHVEPPMDDHADEPHEFSPEFKAAYAKQLNGMPVLELRKVTYRYPKSDRKVLDGLSWEFNRGVFHAVIGPSGAGKTTVLSLLSGLAVPSEGEVLYEGKSTAGMDRYRYRSHDIGVVFQQFNLLPSLTVAENIMLSMDAADSDMTKQEKMVRTRELMDSVRLPEKYMDERILHLSGGEQQRVAIARALGYSPSVILADEPTGNLDPETQSDIVDILARLVHEQGRTVIVVTHSKEVASRADSILTLRRMK